MRIAYVCADPGVPAFGTKGCSIHVQEIVRAFLQRGDSVDLFVTRLGGDRPEDMANCAVHEFPLPRCSSVADRESAQQRLAQAIASDIPMDHYDLVYERHSLWSDATQGMATRCGVPAVLEVNAPLIEEQQSHRELLDRKQAERTARNAFEQAGSIVAVSSEVADYVRQFYYQQTGLSRSGIHVVPNGVDVQRFHPDVQHCEQSRDFTIGFAGSLKVWHGVESLIAAFQRLVTTHPQSRLKIIGDGPMRRALEFSLDPAVAGKTVFTGAVASREMPHHLVSLDVAVAPYLRNDGFYFSPLKVYEYMACGRPVAAGDIGQLSKLIANDRNGLLYEPGNVAQLTSILTRLAGSPSLRRRLGAAARATVVRDHSWHHCLEQILSTAICSPT